MIRVLRYTTDCFGVRVWRWYALTRYVAPVAAAAAIGCGGYVLVPPGGGTHLPPAPPAYYAPPGPGHIILPDPQFTAAGYAIGLRDTAPVPVPAPPAWTVFLAALLALLGVRACCAARTRDLAAAQGITAGVLLVPVLWVVLLWLI